MQIPRLYTPVTLKEGETICLEHQARQHLLRVLRARVGDSVIVFNGQGGEFEATLTEANRDNAVVTLSRFIDVERDSPLAIHLYQSISRGERMDYVIQKATELGIVSITPIFTERCTVKLTADRLEKRIAHWQSIAISACEQCGRCRLPEIKPALNLGGCLSQYQAPGFICDTEAQEPMRQYPKLNGEASLLIGPEGGFANHEIEAAKARGFQSLSLGPRVLRTETAPVVAITLLQAHGGDF